MTKTKQIEIVKDEDKISEVVEEIKDQSGVEDVYEQMERKKNEDRAFRNIRMFFILSELLLDSIEEMKKFGFFKQKVKNLTKNIQKELEKEVDSLMLAFPSISGTETGLEAQVLFQAQVVAIEELCQQIHESNTEEEFGTLISYIRNWARVKDTLLQRVREKEVELGNQPPKQEIIKPPVMKVVK